MALLRKAVSDEARTHRFIALVNENLRMIGCGLVLTGHED
jgi:hypothetical protein